MNWRAEEREQEAELARHYQRWESEADYFWNRTPTGTVIRALGMVIMSALIPMVWIGLLVILLG